MVSDEVRPVTVRRGFAHSMVGDGARYAAKRRRPDRAAEVALARVVAKAVSRSARLLLL